jgi:hypothetical protein
MITLTEVEAAPVDHAEWQGDVCLTGAVSGLNGFRPERDVEADQMVEAAR